MNDARQPAQDGSPAEQEVVGSAHAQSQPTHILQLVAARLIRECLNRMSTF